MAEGAGLRELAEGLGAVVLPAGAGAADIDAARSGLAADEAVIVAVGRVAAAVVVEAGSLPAALACLAVLDPGLGAAENAAEMPPPPRRSRASRSRGRRRRSSAPA